METTGKLIVDMGARCREIIQAANTFDSKLPTALQPSHLLWMCEQLEQHAEDWPATKLHRWIGFVQGAMLAHRMVDLAGAKSMFDDAKLAHSGLGQDRDLADHLDPENSFALDIGGQG
jgi:hypothetical protein